MERLAKLSRHLDPRSASEINNSTRTEGCVWQQETAAQVQEPGNAIVIWNSRSEAQSRRQKELLLKFPQAIPSTVSFPSPASDFLLFDSLLLPAEKDIRDKVRKLMEAHAAPIVADYWERAEFPFELLPHFKSLGVAGLNIQGYGCPGLSTVASALVVMEIARVDASCATFMIVHSSLAMLTIALCGSEVQKQKYLPSLASLDTVACWALTEPDHGSDASALSTVAEKVKGGWILNGRKRWIGNSTFADVIIVFAQNSETNQINGFIVRKGAVGFKAEKMQNKIGLRIVQNGDLSFTNCFVPDADRIPGINSFKDTNKVLAVSRVMVAVQPIGMAMGVYDMCHRYLRERQQFGQPLAALQLNQEKLVRMLGNVQAMQLMGWRLCCLHQQGNMTHGQASLGKAWITLRARETLALGRELLGGNGILLDYHVAKLFCSLGRRGCMHAGLL
eukprot:TRINITY_DN688_c0_g1_i2.p1 TRINITY_DN688_c0_g1~~TRINITY_DN688_c0_g1_i2.p1  ORF type:complete len:448 (+),score=100.74 TRINITY_DN688_c0_g1_i2:3-1346(+)